MFKHEKWTGIEYFHPIFDGLVQIVHGITELSNRIEWLHDDSSLNYEYKARRLAEGQIISFSQLKNALSQFSAFCPADTLIVNLDRRMPSRAVSVLGYQLEPWAKEKPNDSAFHATKIYQDHY